MVTRRSEFAIEQFTIYIRRREARVMDWRVTHLFARGQGNYMWHIHQLWFAGSLRGVAMLEDEHQCTTALGSMVPGLMQKLLLSPLYIS